MDIDFGGRMLLFCRQKRKNKNPAKNAGIRSGVFKGAAENNVFSAAPSEVFMRDYLTDLTISVMSLAYRMLSGTIRQFPLA